MNDWSLYLGAAALLCAACSLLGAGLAHLWGVDPSRETPGTHAKGAARRLLAGRIWGFLAQLPAALWMSAAAGEIWGRGAGAVVCAGYALLCALLAFEAMFASLRHGAKGMAQVCQEELFAAAGRLRNALGMLAATTCAGAMLMSLIRDGQVEVTNGLLGVFALLMWPMMSMQLAAGRFAGVIRSERQMLSVSAGGPVCAALIAMLALLPGAALVLKTDMILALAALIRLCWAASFIALCSMGGHALHGLTRPAIERRKRSTLPYTALCAAVSVLLALYAQAWLFVLAAALCALCVVMDAAACKAWIRHIGRGLFSRY